MEAREFTGKTVEEALTSATIALGVTSDRLNCEVIEKGSSGFLGLGSKDAVICVTIKDEAEVLASESEEADASVGSVESVASDVVSSGSVASSEVVDSDSSSETVDSSEEVEKAEKPVFERRSFEDAEPVDKDEVISRAREFLSSVFAAMKLDVELKIDYEEENRMLSIEMNGPEMGIIIGKRGQTLDSLQYLTNLAVNRKLSSYVRVKMDTEDYRRRRKATLENLARNVAYKVKRTKRPVSLEPMNPYERRVIHYALQHDGYVKTESEGDEPYRHVVVSLK